MKRSIILMALVGVAFGLMACGGSSTPTKQPKPIAPPGAATQPEQPLAEQEETGEEEAATQPKQPTAEQEEAEEEEAASQAPAAVWECLDTQDAPSIGIDWDALEEGEGELTFEVKGLPAISEDGLHIAVAYQADDGARSNPNLALIVIEVASGKEKQRTVVVDVEEYYYGGDRLKPAMLKKRIASANKVLAGRKWTPLSVAIVDLEGSELEDSDGPQRFSACGFGITWAEPRLSIRNDAGKELHSAEYPEWVAPIRCGDQEVKSIDECDDEYDSPCTNPSSIAMAATDAARRVIVLSIVYESVDDLCYGPEWQAHVVKLGESKQ